MDKKKKLMIYGANGYTGALIAKKAKEKGVEAILAGRSSGLPVRFDLSNPGEVISNLKGIDLILNCAGPFSRTAKPVLDACLKTKTSYMDITGEIDVFESIFSRNEEFKDAGITVIPGVGFDVVPTDCMAAILRHEMPDATHLTLAFKSFGGTSRGTKLTGVEGLQHGLVHRKNGKIQKTKLRSRDIDFTESLEPAMLFSWGDISTAYISTKIPNIEVYIAMPANAQRVFKAVMGLSRFGIVRKVIASLVKKQGAGPDQSELETGSTIVWGEVKNASGRVLQKKIKTNHGYQFTADAAVAAVNSFFKAQIPSGALTPSMAFGSDFVFKILKSEV